ncbi:MAG: hypothetical protein ACYTGB_12925 [Planctomycetota bacterium]|jgi:hypothetical protein
MEIAVEATGAGRITLLRGGRAIEGVEDFSLGPFDVLRTPPEKNDGRVSVRLVAGDNVKVKLPAGCELTFADVVREAYEQNRRELDLAALRLASGSMTADQPRPLLIPALRKIIKEGTRPAGKASDANVRAATHVKAAVVHRARWLLNDIWMF